MSEKSHTSFNITDLIDYTINQKSSSSYYITFNENFSVKQYLSTNTFNDTYTNMNSTNSNFNSNQSIDTLAILIPLIILAVLFLIAFVSYHKHIFSINLNKFIFFIFKAYLVSKTATFTSFT